MIFTIVNAATGFYASSTGFESTYKPEPYVVMVEHGGYLYMGYNYHKHTPQGAHYPCPSGCPPIGACNSCNAEVNKYYFYLSIYDTSSSNQFTQTIRLEDKEVISSIGFESSENRLVLGGLSGSQKQMYKMNPDSLT